MRPVTTSPVSGRVATPGRTDESRRPPAGPGQKRRRPGGEAMTPATRRRLADACGYAAMTVVLVIIALPLVWILLASFKARTEIYVQPAVWWPSTWRPENYVEATTSVPFWSYLRNSVIISTLVTVGQVFFSAMAAYSFSRLRWRGRDTVFAVFLGALMVPSIFTLLPNFVLVKQLHLIDTFLGVALPTMFMTPFAVFFLKQFFMNVPRELEEAALLDGASKVRVFFTLILPMAKAPISTLAILTYITAWNDYFWPLLVSYTDSSRVLTVALAVFRSQAPQTGPDWAGLMAATLVAALPMLLLFMAFARRIVNSIGFTGIK